MVVACSLLEARQVWGPVGEEGSEQKCSQHPQGWSPVNKNLFLSTPIVESYILKAPGSLALVCMITVLAIQAGLRGPVIRSQPLGADWPLESGYGDFPVSGNCAAPQLKEPVTRNARMVEGNRFGKRNPRPQ